MPCLAHKRTMLLLPPPATSTYVLLTLSGFLVVCGPQSLVPLGVKGQVRRKRVAEGARGRVGCGAWDEGSAYTYSVQMATSATPISLSSDVFYYHTCVRVYVSRLSPICAEDERDKGVRESDKMSTRTCAAGTKGECGVS